MDYSNSGGTAAQSFAHQTSGPNTGFTHFAMIDPSLNATPPTNSSQLSSHVAASPSPYSNQSPHFNGSPGPGQQNGHVPTDRALPDRDSVTADNLDDAYAQFIVYCNPYLSANIATTELKRIFKKPPMSDNKTFDLWKLYGLIGKLESGEIKTWIQLALDLGVESPGPGQSTQKVQQYAVRLKRWMRALHIDGFFEFLRGRPHNYLNNIPSPDGPVPEVRDGVALEEDLAVRALDPTFRPKRGRRKVDEVDGGSNPTPPKRPQLDTSFALNTPHQHPHSAYAQSALALSAQPNDYSDPWASLSVANAQRGLEPQSAATAPGGQQFRFSQDNPHTPHPMSAVSPMTDRPPDSAFPDDASSAITPSTSKRQRRRHGPAVSSAWPSSSGGGGGKIRGRPPQNRSVRNGPFVTFPANPNAREGPKSDYHRHSSSGQTPVDQTSATQAGQMAPAHNRAGQRLSLQVPQHQGGPVHLVTPTVLVNGQSDSPHVDQVPQFTPTGKPAPMIEREDLKRLLVADLLRADLTNRKRLRGQEAKDLADSLLNRLSSQNDGPSLVLCSSGKSDLEMQLVAFACWLGYAAQLGVANGPVPGGQKKIAVQKYRISGDGYE
ncbi:ARS binding protein 2-domain-containing protein, partial [Phyllosticta citrichinensis]